MCGFSGLPKLRQLVSPSGSAPTQARLARALEHRLHRARVRIAGHPPAVAVDRDREGAARRRPARARAPRRRPPAGRRDGARAHDRVVLLEHPALAGDVGRAQQGEQRVPRLGVVGEPRGRRRVDRLGRRLGLEVVERAVVHQRLHRHVADQLVAVEHAQPARVGDRADRRGAHLPARAEREHLVQPLRLHHAQHALLRLRDHDLERLHVGLAQRHARHVDVEADLALRRHLRRARGRAPQRPGPGATRAARASSSSRQHSTSFDSSNGSPIWTLGRFDSSSSSSSALASTEAPPMPSRPVRAPSSTRWLPTPAAALRISRSRGAMPTHIAFTRQFCS